MISGTGSYQRTASTAATGGTTIFTAGNTYSGGTTINDGLLLVNNTVSTESGTGTGAVTVGAGTAATAFRGTLGGTGYVGGAITVQEGGTVAPGADASIGTLTAAGNVTFTVNGHLAIQLSGASADKLVVGGNIILSAAEFLDVTGTGTGSSWLIGTYGGTATGTFDTVTPGYAVTIGSGLITLNSVAVSLPGDFNNDGKVDAGDYVTWRKNQGTNNALANDNGLGTPIGTSHYDLWRANFGKPPGAGSGGGLGGAMVPEPSVIVLLAIGLFAVAVRRRG
jgi:fibronectin-binding autotransporter adhesin